MLVSISLSWRFVFALFIMNLFLNSTSMVSFAYIYCQKSSVNFLSRFFYYLFIYLLILRMCDKTFNDQLADIMSVRPSSRYTKSLTINILSV